MKTPKSMTWESLVIFLDPARESELDTDVQLLKELNPRLAASEWIPSGSIVNIPGRALNVSYTEEGLKWTSSKTKYLYFNQANSRLVLGKTKNMLVLEGDLSKSPKVFVEDFVPRNHYRGSVIHPDQPTEYLWVDKGLRLLYVQKAQSLESELEELDLELGLKI